MDSATSISYTTRKGSQFDAAFCLVMRSFDHITASGLKFDVIFEFSDTIFGDFCDDNVGACAVSALILLLVVNMSPKMASDT